MLILKGHFWNYLYIFCYRVCWLTNFKKSTKRFFYSNITFFYKGTVVQSSSGGSSSGRRKVAKPRYRVKRKKNIAKFVDRENLSETELNTNLTDKESDEDVHNSKNKLSSKNSNPPKNLDAIINAAEIAAKSHTSSTHAVTQQTSLNSNQAILTLGNQSPTDFLNTHQQTDMDFVQMNYLNNASSVNFKEFSSQLVSRFAMIQDNTVSTSTTNASNTNELINQNAQIGDEFIDNEIYKFVLNGKRNVTIPPGFDLKEAREIEELGEKIATFQIETDTEMSLFNTDTNSSTSSSSSSSNHSENEDFVWDENKDNDGIKNLAKLNEIKKNRLIKSQMKQQHAADSKSSKSNSIKSSKLLDLKKHFLY